MNLQNIWTDDNKLRQVFSWLTRIGAAPKFGSRPVGWYQQHQCAAIEYLEKKHAGDCELRSKDGFVQARAAVGGRWNNIVTICELYAQADHYSRTHSFQS